MSLLGAAINAFGDGDLFNVTVASIALEVHVRAGSKDVNAMEIRALDQGIDAPRVKGSAAIVIDTSRHAVITRASGGSCDGSLRSSVPIFALELPMISRHAAVGDLEVEVACIVAGNVEVNHLARRVGGAQVLPCPLLLLWFFLERPQRASPLL